MILACLFLVYLVSFFFLIQLLFHNGKLEMYNLSFRAIWEKIIGMQNMLLNLIFW